MKDGFICNVRRGYVVLSNVDVSTLPIKKTSTSLQTSHLGKREEVNVDGITMPINWRKTAMRWKKDDFFEKSGV